MEQVTCHGIAQATSRDAEAQTIVDNLDQAMNAAREAVNTDVELYELHVVGATTQHYFYREGKPAPDAEQAVAYVTLGPVGEVLKAAPIARVGKPLPLERLTFEDLSLGPSAAVEALKALYPAVEARGIFLLRQGHDCRLMWIISASIPVGDYRTQLPASVDAATGAVTVHERVPQGAPGRP